MQLPETGKTMISLWSLCHFMTEEKHPYLKIWKERNNHCKN